ncbi:hypothetical protein TWF730_007418 [Orbilia blumenaviensis]|uniref:Uncharacterized protein n=1 Tax=Orbilia blumenaviensis TaxID=1796055 RepID=A0AAV9V8W7_9PEZI
MMFLPVVTLIWATSVAAAPHVPRSPSEKVAGALDWLSLRKGRPDSSTNQYYGWYDNIFEDHWGDRNDIKYSAFLEEVLRAGRDTTEFFMPQSECKELVTPVDPDPEFAGPPRDTLAATAIFCNRGIMVLVQYDPALAEPPQPKEPRNIKCRAYMYKAYELAAAIDAKYRDDDNSPFDPIFKGRKAIPQGDGESFREMVYQELVKYQYDPSHPEVMLQVVGRTRWSLDQSEWIILAILENGSQSCPFRVDAISPAK